MRASKQALIALGVALALPAGASGAVYTSTDVPLTVPPGAGYGDPQTGTSTLVVPAGRPPVGELRVRGLTIALSPRESKITLTSPQGTTVVLFDRVQCSSTTVWSAETTGFSLADRAGFPLNAYYLGWPDACAPGSRVYSPGGPPEPEGVPGRLDDFAGEPSSGTWTLTVTNAAAGWIVQPTPDAVVESWGLEVVRDAEVAESWDTPIDVPPDRSVTSELEVEDEIGAIAELDVAWDAYFSSYSGRLTVSLTSPAGTTALVDGCWVNARTYSSDQFWCQGSDPRHALDVFRGESPVGTWHLTIVDEQYVSGEEEWSLEAWTLRIVPMPETWIDDGPDEETYETEAVFDFSSSAEDATFECALDGAAFEACSPPVSLSGTAPGSTHSFRVRATDTDGRVDPTPAQWEWSVEARQEVAGTVVVPAPAPVAVRDRRAPQVQLRMIRGQRIRTLRRTGLRLRAVTDERCTGTALLWIIDTRTAKRLRVKQLLASKRIVLAPGPVTITLKPSKKAAARLAKARRLKLGTRVACGDDAANVTPAALVFTLGR